MSVELSTDTIIDKVFAGFKKITPALVAIALASGIMIFLPEEYLLIIGIKELVERTRTGIGITFLISVVLIITIVTSKLYKTVRSSWGKAVSMKKCERMYLGLSSEHKNLINKIMNDKNKSISLNITSGDTQYLVNNGFIYRPPQLIPYDGENVIAKYVPQPWLIDLHNKKPKLFRSNNK